MDLVVAISPVMSTSSSNLNLGGWMIVIFTSVENITLNNEDQPDNFYSLPFSRQQHILLALDNDIPRSIFLHQCISSSSMFCDPRCRFSSQLKLLTCWDGSCHQSQQVWPQNLKLRQKQYLCTNPAQQMRGTNQAERTMHQLWNEWCQCEQRMWQMLMLWDSFSQGLLQQPTFNKQ